MYYYVVLWTTNKTRKIFYDLNKISVMTPISSIIWGCYRNRRYIVSNIKHGKYKSSLRLTRMGFILHIITYQIIIITSENYRFWLVQKRSHGVLYILIYSKISYIIKLMSSNLDWSDPNIDVTNIDKCHMLIHSNKKFIHMNCSTSVSFSWPGFLRINTVYKLWLHSAYFNNFIMT